MCYNFFVKRFLRFLHLHFIPHERNAYQPHFLRPKVTAGILTLVLFVEAVYLANIFVVLPRSDYFAAVFASVLVDQTNERRTGNHLAMLAPNAQLKTAARLKAEDMAAKGYFAHVTPDGKSPWYWFEQAGYRYSAAGENLAVNFTDSSDVTEAWMNSPTHRANIMNGNYTEIGIATAHGTYKGREAIFVVEEFGRPLPIAKSAPLVTSQVKIATPFPRTFTAPVAQMKPIVPATVPASTTNAPTVVAGAETVAQETNASVPAETIIPSAYVSQKTSRISELVASPRRVTTMFYIFLSAILALALGLAIFIEIRIQHKHIILNGLLLIALITSIVALNAAIGFGEGVILAGSSV